MGNFNLNIRVPVSLSMHAMDQHLTLMMDQHLALMKAKGKLGGGKELLTKSVLQNTISDKL